MLRRFRHWLSRFADQPPQPHEAPGHNNAAALQHKELNQERTLRLAAESELQKLRLDLQQAEQRLAQLQADLQRQDHQQHDVLSESLNAHLEELLRPLATPFAQLLTQQHLIEQQGKELSTKDLLATSRRLWEGLAPAGLEAVESIGSVVAFDPDRHQPLSQATSLINGESVRVRIPGITFRGRILKTAAVEDIALDDASVVATTA
ncbi:nucleotide exchange factor GrpE [Synechococcus sp. CBW1107]|uniref:nucleotide exchange factor GrpE n=1 Tax=Synechococcus sp. CBW1107 TaxID=2789857 RepID=UPI0018CD9151|nr:nucleotide exchange factor GrpE [Synechococcus sp. CBW1107]QPN57001.1 nucleotide exchange factor GrpE [Synechococcus sp. CBW1107]